MKKTLLLLCLACALTPCQQLNAQKKHRNTPAPQSAPQTIQQTEVKNVIFVIGDGMGTAQVYASIVAQQGQSQFLRFPFSGFSRTYSNNKYTTDSGAGGSALMTGHKVDNYHIALGPDGTPYPSILTTAHRELGKSTGFVCTCTVLDATPASTYGHVTDRHLFDSLSMQMALCEHDVMIGADMKHFMPAFRKDSKAPIDTLEGRGYKMAYSMKDLLETQSNRICALLSNDDAPGDAEARDNWLVPSTMKALQTLNQNPKGFVMMVEGSQIDWAGHNNDFPYLLKELSEFEQTLATILAFAEQDGHTLVVVTADHETGGLTLNDGNINDGTTTNPKFTTGSHTGVMVPVFAYGPGAEHFSGIHENTDFYNIILNLLR